MAGTMERKVVLAMSGGVDSSVAALLLKQQGYHVTGVFMDSGLSRHSSDAGTHADDARRAAEHLGIELHVLDLAAEFERLIDAFVDEYLRGRTPNPCVLCNRDLKFGRLAAHGDTLGADFMATGHYARVRHSGGEPALLRAADPLKDQSYALFAVPPARLRRVLLPLGDWTKPQVRRLARDQHLPAHNREESQDICFVIGDYMDLIRARRPDALRPGPIVDETGREVGRHEGIAAFTIGQRKGLRIAFGEPRYVTRIDPATATVVVGPSDDLLAAGALVENLHWLTPAAPDGPFEADVQIRYRHTAASARVVRSASDPGAACVRFAAPQRAVTPGQAAVFYQGDRVLGGGWIARPLGEQEARF